MNSKDDGEDRPVNRRNIGVIEFLFGAARPFGFIDTASRIESAKVQQIILRPFRNAQRCGWGV
jgi:hypothetical protein